MINSARDRWFESSDCSVKEMIEYMERKGEMRQSQIDAIKTYLYLKIHCDKKPLWELFAQGYFNDEINLDEVELKSGVRKILEENPSAMALFQYSCLKDEKDASIFDKLNKEIKTNAENINFRQVIKDMFNGISFTNYLFSLPMGGGKTFLMASFIYLDLAFALNEPENSNFAHNFIICVPSGLKNSVVPSLRSIKDFDATWILPEETVKQVKEILKFEVLDEIKTDNKSNKVKNPNVQKVASYQPFNTLMGLVLVTNAEKVIIDNINIDKAGQTSIDDFKASERATNELKRIISQIPNLQVMVDEVHHLANDNIKLNHVVEYWKINGSMNCLIGFSGTPYYNKKQKLAVTKNWTYTYTQIPFVVNHYPLLNAIRDFLKTPRLIKSTSNDYLYIIEQGLKEFFDNYKDKVYFDGTCAKVAIYCGRIAKLRVEVYQKCVEVARLYGLNPDEAILAYHGNDSTNTYICTEEEKKAFRLLDYPQSKVRIVLLSQIGKEGWNCKSLTGVILSQEGDCPKNMVLQTACRCLRQVDKNDENETALICLNESNYKVLDSELAKEQRTTIEEISNIQKREFFEIQRFDRTKHLNLPSVEMFQLKVKFQSVKCDDKKTVGERLKEINPIKKIVTKSAIKDIADRDNSVIEFAGGYGNKLASFSQWLVEIAKGSLGLLKVANLLQYQDIIKELFNKITFEKDGLRYFNQLFDNEEVMSEIRKAYQDKWTFVSSEEVVGETKSLLNSENWTSTIKTDSSFRFYPMKGIIEQILMADRTKSPFTAEQQRKIKVLKENGMEDMIKNNFPLAIEVENRDKSFHYLPYNFSQSAFEEKTLKNIFKLPAFNDKQLEVYYNGDRAMTEFKIRCFKKKGEAWRYIGVYTPDFLIVQRKNDKIDKALIIETKGQGFANDKLFNDKMEFVKNKFLEINKEKFGYFYVQDDEEENVVLEKLNNKINELFK